MNKETLQAGLKTKIFGRNLIYFDVTGSTNEEAKRKTQNKLLPEGTVYLASRQTAGRGTEGNSWLSDNMEGLLFSLVINYDEKVSPITSLLPSIAIVNVLKNSYNIPAHVKWPNDVLIDNKKVCGILCEGVPGKQLIIGVGVNVNQKSFQDEIAHKAISMFQVTNKNYPIEKLFQLYMLEMENLFYSNTDLREEWIKNSKMFGKRITAIRDNKAVSVVVTGISPEGYLEVMHPDGKKEEWISRAGLDIDTNY